MTAKRYTPENITELATGEIFVFGSNLAGRHGKGAAKFARKFGAMPGIGVGFQGATYAIPTKDWQIETLSLDSIDIFVKEFLQTARAWSGLTFLVTPIGCGLAGHSPKDIAPMFRDAPPNVILPREFYP